MKKLLAVTLLLTLILTGCGGNEVETTKAETTSFVVTTADTTAAVTEEAEPDLDMDSVTTVEDFFGDDAVYTADFDGDGADESCTVHVVGHGTQYYEEALVIAKQNGDVIEVESPEIATAYYTDFYKNDGEYILYFDGAADGYSVPFASLFTREENLMNIGFGDISEYTVIGDKLYFRGSLACGMSEVIGEIVYEYAYTDGALRVYRMWYNDIINGTVLYLGEKVPRDSLLVESAARQAIASLPSPADDALLEGGPVGGLPRFYTFDEGLTYYVTELPDPYGDITLRKYSQCELDLPRGYDDGKIVNITGGGGSGEAFIIVEAVRGGEKVYLEYYFESDNVTLPLRVREVEEVFGF